MLIPITQQVFSEETIFIDGVRFVGCRFINCQLVYQASDEIDFQDCTFERCSWTFVDAAERTIGALATLYRELGNEERNLVEGVFESIRSQKVIQIRGSAHLQAGSELRAEGTVVEPALAR